MEILTVDDLPLPTANWSRLRVEDVLKTWGGQPTVLRHAHPELVPVGAAAHAEALRARVVGWRSARSKLHLDASCPRLADLAGPVVEETAVLGAQTICSRCAGSHLDTTATATLAALRNVSQLLRAGEAITTAANWAVPARTERLQVAVAAWTDALAGGALHPNLIALSARLDQLRAPAEPGAWASSRSAALRLRAAAGRSVGEGIGWGGYDPINVEPQLANAVSAAGVNPRALGRFTHRTERGAPLGETLCGPYGLTPTQAETLIEALQGVECNLDPALLMVGSMRARSLLSDDVIAAHRLHTAAAEPDRYGFSTYDRFELVIAAGEDLAYLRAAADLDVWELGPMVTLPPSAAGDVAAWAAPLASFLSVEGTTLTEQLDRVKSGVACRDRSWGADMQATRERWEKLVRTSLS